MGIPVLILGESGSGKTHSIKNFNVDEVGIFSVEKNRLPFRDKEFKVAKQATYESIIRSLKKANLKAYVIDDSQYLMVNEMFERAKETGYQKFTDIALHFRSLINVINRNTPDDVVVYFLHHTETDSNTGKEKAKTVGKMLDNQLTVEGCFDVVLFTSIESGNHYFITQSDGFTTAKSPEGMFTDIKIPNDLKLVDTAIREFWNLDSVEKEESDE